MAIHIPGFEPTRVAVKEGNNWRIHVKPPALMGMESSSILLTEDQYERFKDWLETGDLIQNVLPDLTASQREILVSGIGPEVWDREFSDKEDD